MSVEPYYADDAVTIYHGEALATLAELPEASCDVLLTDPPYSSGGIGIEVEERYCEIAAKRCAQEVLPL